jgi:glycosyltransferase involved in cell wall biosynthesis
LPAFFFRLRPGITRAQAIDIVQASIAYLGKKGIMNMFPLTLIIPHYNRSALLQRTLQSLTQQSNKQFHVILVDHGSTEDVSAIVTPYMDLLSMEYYRIEKNDYFSPGVPRDFGVKHAKTPFIAFLDVGTLVPPSYVAAHVTFHQQFPQHVGIGLQHGAYDEETSERLEPVFAQTDDIHELEKRLLEDPDWCDRRLYLNFAELIFPWTSGWTSNLSLPREAYLATGGFDLDIKGWGFEDVDLSYRLYRQGLAFARVENGWSVAIPHPRTDLAKRLETLVENMYHCYRRQRTLALECILYEPREAWKGADETFLYLAELGQHFTPLPPLSEEVWRQFAHPSLLIGGQKQEAERFDYVALADEQVVSTESLWSCSGVVIPLLEHSLNTVVVSEVWQKLGWSHSFTDHTLDSSLLARLIKEIRRTAQKAYFLYSSSTPTPDGVTVDELESLCAKQGLAFQLIRG